MVIYIEEWDFAAASVATPEPPPQPVQSKVSAAKHPENHAARAKVGDLVRYTPFFPERSGDLVTGVIVKAFRGCLGGYGWKIRAVSAQDGKAFFVRRYSSGGSLMIIHEGTDIQ